jgi:hypothetical protein
MYKHQYWKNVHIRESPVYIIGLQALALEESQINP